MYKGYITATLLNTFVSKYDIMPLLRREKIEQNEAMLNGIKFEKQIMNGEIAELQELIKDSFYQKMLYKPMGDYMLFGFADLIKGFKIYDFKYVKNYEIGKYREAIQHLLYLYCADMQDFEYIIGTKEGFIFYEYYQRNDEKLKQTVNQFDNWLDITGNRKLYTENYSMERLEERYHVN